MIVIQRFRAFIGMLIVMCLSSKSSAQTVMIVHPDCPFIRASSAEVKKIFLGEITTWRDKYPVIPVNQERGTEERKALLHRIVKMREKEYQKHWHGKAEGSGLKPPLVFGSNADVVRFVRENKNAIGYIEAMYPREGVKLLFIDGSEVW